MSKGFNIFYHILTFFTIRKTEQKELDMNHIPPIRNMETISIFSKNFAPLYPIFHISTAFFYKQAKLQTNTDTLILSRKTRILSRKLPTFA